MEELNPGILKHMDHAVEWNTVKEDYFNEISYNIIKRLFKYNNKKKVLSLDLRRFLRYNIYIQQKVFRLILFKYLEKRKTYTELIEKAVEDRLIIVKRNARNLMKNLEEKNLTAIEELKGMDYIEIISYDPISITVFYPRRD